MHSTSSQGWRGCQFRHYRIIGVVSVSSLLRIALTTRLSSLNRRYLLVSDFLRDNPERVFTPADGKLFPVR
jgi:hypothetical protein